ncbi:MAG TPA: zf-HC2 domain-containing protein [Gemmatimonadales bacterium]|nr:zf-HC2 domain-containing protein [Gemmatimonadales bacterium]
MDAHLGEQLSALVDGEVEGEALAAAQAHLVACGECRDAYDALLRLKRHAGALDDRPPERDLWPGIAARLGESATVVPLAPRRRLAFSVPQLAAAAVVLMAVSAGSVLLVTRGARTAAAVGAAAPAAALQPVAGLASAKGIESYDAAIRELQAALDARRSVLDTATVRAVQQSLAIIDLAVRQAEAALAQDPNSMYLNSHLERALGRKLEVLRRVTTMAAAS